MRFITDGMLGKLTRWLRLAGQDVICINDIPVESEEEDQLLLKCGKEDSRVLITRDQDLHRRALMEGLESVLVEEDDVAEQLVEVSESVQASIDVEMENSRCPICNGVLEEVEKQSVSGDVPDLVLENNERFWRCGGCGKIYWPGSHWDKITEIVERYERLRGNF